VAARDVGGQADLAGRGQDAGPGGQLARGDRDVVVGPQQQRALLQAHDAGGGGGHGRLLAETLVSTA
jgi:hypothetical protein